MADDPPFRAVAEAIGLGMAFQILVPPDGSDRRFTYVSPSCEALNGVPAAEVIADAGRLYDLILPEHRAAFAAAEAAAHKAGKPFDIEIQMLRPDGSSRWFRVASSPRVLPDGSTLWDGLQTDVTDRRWIAKQLEEQRRRLEAAVEATGLGIWELDVRTGTLQWSDRNRALFGVAHDDEVTLQRYLELVHPEDIPLVREAYLAAREQPEGGDFAIEYRVTTPGDEERWILSRGRVIADEQGPRQVVGTSLDVTERRVRDERRNLLMGELAHRAKNGIAIIMAIVSQTARGSTSVADFEAMLIARLQAMATSQDLVTAAGGRPVDLVDVLKQAVTAFGLSRIDVDPALSGVTISGQVAIGLGLLFHEMGTNAVKYGALCNAKGRVAVTRDPAGTGRAAFVWRETRGPRVVSPSRPGFGTRLMQQALRHHDGKVTFEFDPAGFHARVEFPTEE